MTHVTRGYAGLDESSLYYQVDPSNHEPYEKQSRNVTIYFFQIIEFHIEWIGSDDLATFLGLKLSICAKTVHIVHFWPRPYCRGSTTYRTEPEMQSSNQWNPSNSSLEVCPIVFAGHYLFNYEFNLRQTFAFLIHMYCNHTWVRSALSQKICAKTFPLIFPRHFAPKLMNIVTID